MGDKNQRQLEKAEDQKVRIRDFTDGQMGDLARELENRRLWLSPDQQRVLSNFWNARKSAIYDEVPVSVVKFFEASGLESGQRVISNSRTDLLITELDSKKFVRRTRATPSEAQSHSRDADAVALEKDGLRYMLRLNSEPLIWWTSI